MHTPGRLPKGKTSYRFPAQNKKKRLEENIQSMYIGLTDSDFKFLGEIAPPGAAAGSRYPQEIIHTLNR